MELRVRSNVSWIPEGVVAVSVPGRVNMSPVTRLARSLPVVSLICALAVLPGTTLQWSESMSSDDDGPLQAWTAGNRIVGAVWGRGSNDLRELVRASEREGARFLMLASQSGRLHLSQRAAARRRAASNQHQIAARRSLLRYASGRADDDPPA
jgi:hypothetical protein